MQTLQKIQKDFTDKRLKSKHQASKKGFKHVHKLSKGELKHLKFLDTVAK